MMVSTLETFSHHPLIVVTYPTLVRVFTADYELYDEYCPRCYDAPHTGRCE